MEAQKRAAPVRRPEEDQPATPGAEKKKNRDYYIDKVVSGRRSERTNFERPRSASRFPARSLAIIASCLALLAVSFYFWRSSNDSPDGQVAGTNEKKTEKWYSVRVSTGESFYGQATDLSSDPVELRNVYYDYDRFLSKGRDSAEAPSATSSLRLVKRGKETHGPDGSMEIVRSQIIYFEPLKEDSKVLKAILENEKK